MATFKVKVYEDSELSKCTALMDRLTVYPGERGVAKCNKLFAELEVMPRDRETTYFAAYKDTIAPGDRICMFNGKMVEVVSVKLAKLIGE